MRPGDGAGDRTQARVSFAAPGKALVEHEHLVHFAVPFPEELRPFAEPASSGLWSHAVRPVRLPQKLERLGVEAAEGLRLNSIGYGADEEFATRLARRIGPPQRAPLLSQLAIRAIGQGQNPCGNRGSQLLL